MAVRAVLGLEDALSPLRFSWFFEVANRVEECKQIGCLFRVHFRKRNLLLVHRLPHHGSMVPHAAGDSSGRIVAVEAPPQIGSAGSTFTTDGVAVHAHLCSEKLRAAACVR